MIRRNALINDLKDELITFVTNKSLKENVLCYCEKQFEMPHSIVLDVLDRAELDDRTDFELFIIASAFDKVLEGKKYVEQFFTANDIKDFSNLKYETEKVKYPIRIKCWKVNKEQFIGITDVAQLMDFRKAQLIIYNDKTQRVMKKIISGNEERYEISVNAKAVKQIQDSLREKYYISNTITLNISEDVDADFEYDEEKGELVIYKIDHFDILDGYHRYLALSHESDIDNSFNYPMEIRITTFSEDKARQFIFQEDQKTKMRKVDSDSMNMNSASNQIVDSLNDKGNFAYRGEINRNQGLINFSDMSSIINYCYFNGKTTKLDRKEIIKTTNDIAKKFTDFVSYYPDLVEHKYTFNELLVVIYSFTLVDEISEEYAKAVEETLNKANCFDKELFKGKQVRAAHIKYIDKQLNIAMEG